MTWNERLMPVFRDVNQMIQRVAEEAAALEREACAKLVESEHLKVPGSPTFDDCVAHVAAAIRKRK